MIIGLIDEAVSSGARQAKACEVIGLSCRTIQRWRQQDEGDDKRRGPAKAPKNKLTKEERNQVLEVVNSPKYRDLSPKQIVPKLADQGKYIASESTIYRVLREEKQLVHREPSRPRVHHKPNEHVANGPSQVWTWDITYMRSVVRGVFFYLYLVIDIWSRKIVGWRVEESESMDYSAELIDHICMKLGIDLEGLVVHSDNGGPMRGATMVSTLQRLGIIPSFSRPHVSDDNPYSEALFRTMKYRPWYPSRPFESIEEARAWVEFFVEWYNNEHLHSAIKYVTPADRHDGQDNTILARRDIVYKSAQAKHPERWSGRTRNWSRVRDVILNPDRSTGCQEKEIAAA